jgi:hypothetical protein
VRAKENNGGMKRLASGFWLSGDDVWYSAYLLLVVSPSFI